MGLDVSWARAPKLYPSVIMKSRLRTLGVSRRGLAYSGTLSWIPNTHMFVALL